MAYYHDIVLLLLFDTELVDKALVDLQRVKRHLGKERQRRVTGTEVVHRYLEAPLAQFFKDPDHVVHVLVCGALCKFELDILMVHMISVYDRYQVLYEILKVEPAP